MDKSMRTNAICAAAVVFAIACPIFASDGGDCFAKPEDVVQAFCERLGEGDFYSVAALFGAERMAAVSVHTPIVPGFNLEMTLLVSDHPSYVKLRKILYRDKAMLQIRMFLIGLLLADDFPALTKFMPHMVMPDEGDTVGKTLDTMAKALNPERLRNLRVVRMDRFMGDKSSSDAYAQGVMTYKILVGVEDFAEYFILYEMNGEHHMGLVALQKPDNGWEMVSLFGLFTTNHMGRFKSILPKVTVEEYEAAIAE